MSTLPVIEGFAPFNPPNANKPCKTWYTIIGDLNITKTNPKIHPLLIIHGGPGIAHHYLTPHTDLTTNYSIPIIFYDQLGCGNSTHLREKAGDTTFWVLELFVLELENLISHLQLENYDLLGSSWGGQFGSKFAAKKPKGLRRLILANTAADLKLRYESTMKYRLELPLDIQETITKHEKNQDFDNPEYNAAFEVFVRRHMCSLYPLPEPEMKSEIEFSRDTTVADVMSGKDRFKAGGTLKDFSMVGQAGNIEVPTLLINGNKEIASDYAIEPFWREIKRVKWVKMMGSTHSPHLEERERYMEIVGEFLTEE